MKRLIFFFCILALKFTSAQENKSGIPIPMKNGIVFYESTIAVDKSISKEKWVARAEKWLKSAFPDSKEKMEINKEPDKISSTGIFKVITDDAADHFYWIKANVSILLQADSCTLQFYNYYEKPIMPGVTNDYSKIEYRWWDFRKGKPWNLEDAALFKGLHHLSQELIHSFTFYMRKQ